MHVTCGFGRATRRVYVLVVLVLAITCRRIIRTRNNGPIQRELVFKTAAPQPELYIHRRSTTNRSGIQQQPAALLQPLAFVTATVIMCVCCLCVQSAPQCSCTYAMHGLGVGSMLIAARLPDYTQLDRASSMQQTDLGVNDLPSLPASSQQHLSQQGSQSQQLCTVYIYEYEYVSYVPV